MRKFEGILYLVGFIASIWIANWLIAHWATVKFPDSPYMIEVWPGWLTSSGNAILAPSGVLAIGLSFTPRDWVQRRLVVRVAMLAIIAGAALSVLDQAFALASGAAFLLAESLDLFVYTPLQRRKLVGAVVASHILGMLVESSAFLTIAFGSFALLRGQIIGRAWMALASLPVIYGIRAWDRRRGGWRTTNAPSRSSPLSIRLRRSPTWDQRRHCRSVRDSDASSSSRAV